MTPSIHMNYCSNVACRISTAKSPYNYLGWHAWAEKKSRANYQEKCPKCGLYTIWKHKDNVLSKKHLIQENQHDR